MAIKFKTGNKFWNNLKGQFTLTEGKNRLSVLTEEVSDKNKGNLRIIADSSFVNRHLCSFFLHSYAAKVNERKELGSKGTKQEVRTLRLRESFALRCDRVNISYASENSVKM